MTTTLLTAAALQLSVYEPSFPPPEGIVLGERYDVGTIQGTLYRDAMRGVVGLGLEGTNRDPSRIKDWATNLFAWPPVEVDGHDVHRGWWAAGMIERLADWCVARGVTEVQGYSKGAAEAQLLAWRLTLRLGRPVQFIALSSPNPWHGTPPLLAGIALKNPDDMVCLLPPPPAWKCAGTTFVLPWEPPDWGDDHRMPELLKALRISSIGHVALLDSLPVAEPVVKSSSRGLAVADAIVAKEK